jgi:UDP-glucose 4-epimerase
LRSACRLNTAWEIRLATCLVTGGAGFIGSHVAAALVGRGHRVVVLDDLSGGSRDYVPAVAQFVQGCVTDAGLVDRLFAEHRFEHVFHLAAYAAEGLSHFIRRFNYTNNVIGSMTLINAAVNSGSRTFVFASSIAVYGASQIPMLESTPPEPEDSYGVAKYAVELDLKAAHHMFGLDYVIFRPHNVYGEHQNIGDRYRNVIGIFMNQIMKGQPMTIFGDGEQTRAFTYVGDVAPIIARAIEIPAALNQVFNVGADIPHSVNYLARATAVAMGVPGATVQYLEPRKEVVHAYSAHDKVRAVFGLGDPMSLEEGLARMAPWAWSAGPRESSRFEHIEVMKNLPASWKP